MPSTFFAAFVVVSGATVAACGGAHRGSTTPRPAGPPVKLDGAALPYEVLSRQGSQLDEPAFWSKVASARAVCVGEEHPNPHHHWVQLRVVRELAGRFDGKTKFALGLEMVQRPFQGALDDYAANKIDAETLRTRVGWATRWGYDYDLYGPMLDETRAAGGALLALNTARELTKKVVRKGLDALTADERAQVPELKLDDANHRAWFTSLMEGIDGSGAHGAKPKDGAAEEPVANPHKREGDDEADGEKVEMPNAERVYTAQVLWDETMADGAVQWLKANPGGHVVILAGNGHCHDSAIVGRIKRRGIADVISLRTVVDDGESAVSDVIAKPMHDYVIVLKRAKPAPAAPTATSSAH